MASASNRHTNPHRLSLHHSPQIPNPNPNPNPNLTTTDSKNPTPLRLRSDSPQTAEPINNINNDNNHASSSAMALDGSDSDSAVLSRSEFLTRQEVLSRRSRRLKRLAKVYREHYWSMMEDVKVKFREYYWEYGKSPFQEGEILDRGEVNQGNGKLGLGSGANGSSAGRCEVHGCKVKAMALTKFCHSHILSDAKQKLYKGCSYATKSSATGPTLCMKPILRSTVPSLCPLHLEKAEKHVTRALRKAGLNVTSTSKLAPKFHVVVAEYVRQIQSKRRAAQKALGVSIESKEGNTM
ncbi:uncharacterized protein LOC131327202 [Rhododendron vialii]|uniref:uncharacterized protein LOC131327202 n=1 Tax=Rhododendron vialii TaxID=182163 RepID=UPI00265F1402|nr:uncharacterized protein LOC131327202 [Rhododendron vialii]